MREIQSNSGKQSFATLFSLALKSIHLFFLCSSRLSPKVKPWTLSRPVQANHIKLSNYILHSVIYGLWRMAKYGRRPKFHHINMPLCCHSGAPFRNCLWQRPKKRPCYSVMWYYNGYLTTLLHSSKNKQIVLKKITTGTT